MPGAAARTMGAFSKGCAGGAVRCNRRPLAAVGMPGVRGWSFWATRSGEAGWPAGERATVEFRAPVRAVAPGQSVALYLGDELLGGGRIVAALR